MTDFITDKKLKNFKFVENTDGVSFRAAGLLNVVAGLRQVFSMTCSAKNM